MNLINIYVKEQEKKQLQEYIAKHGKKSMSDFVRKVIAEKLQVEEVANQSVTEDVEIPDYIPKNKYVLFANNTIVAVGDTPNEVALIAATKRIQPPYVIKFNGKGVAPKEYCYMSLEGTRGWKYTPFEGKTYPLVLMEIEYEGSEKPIIASIDTAASVCVMKEDFLASSEFIQTRVETLNTAAGEVTAPFYMSTIKILETNFEMEFIFAPISDDLPFQFLIGRNLLDLLDAFFFGKKQVFWLKPGEN